MPLILRSGFLAASRRMGCAALMVRDARRRAPHHEGQRTTLLRPIHHSPRFQLTLVISARLSAIIDPKRDAATCCEIRQDGHERPALPAQWHLCDGWRDVERA